VRPDARPWIVLRLETGSPFGPGAALLHYFDSAGVVLRAPPLELEVVPKEPDASARRIVLPPDIGERVEALAGTLPDVRGPHVEGPLRVPVFLGLGGLEDSHALFAELSELVVRLGPAWPVELGTWQVLRRPPFRLPFHVATLPGTELLGEALFDSGWTRELGERGPYALRVESMSLEQVAKGALDDVSPDILVTLVQDLELVLERSRETFVWSSPRLIVAIDDSEEPRIRSHQALPEGCSLLIPSRAASPVLLIQELIAALVHDLPLHDALAEMGMRQGLGPLDLHLWSDPDSDHALRISEAQGALKRETFEVEPLLTLRETDLFLKRIGPDAAVVGPQLRRARGDGDRLISATDKIRSSEPVAFDREQHGLFPLAEDEMSLALSADDRHHVEQLLIDLGSDPEAADVMQRHQQRHVDVALASQSFDRLLPRDWVLAEGAQYQLLVRIGGTFAQSLLAAEPPAIDPLLPDPPGVRGHELEVVVYPIDFGHSFPATERVVLPRFGASEVAHFSLTAPRADDGRIANARIAIYHENHLVQSFMLHSEVRREEGRSDTSEGGLRVELEFSRTERFENIQELGPRALSLTVNDSGTGTHRVTFKGDGIAQDFSFPESMLDVDMDGFRTTLEEATQTAPDVPRFTDDPAEGAERDAAEEYIRRLARDGRKLYEQFGNNAGEEFFEALRAFAKGSDKTIQIIRLDANYALPWAAFYDFVLPDDSAPVCLGVDAGGAPCAHDGGVELDCYCIYGFWGARHRIEQFLVPIDRDASAERTLEAVTGRPPALVALGVDDQWTAGLVSDLETIAPRFVAQAPEGSDMLDVVWDEATRPTYLVVVGHLDGATDLPRIKLSATQTLDGTSVFTRAQLAGRLRNPRPLVFLMACGSSATKLATHAGLSLAVWSAGAAAVVGTEATVFTPLVQQFVDGLVRSLWNGSALGEAMTDFRRQRLKAANPLAFVFTAFGDADLKVEK
jgi:hypothetical protein